MRDDHEIADDSTSMPLPGGLAIERLIQSAGNYVTASADLRPRVIEVARERASDRRMCWRIFSVMAAAVMCVVIGTAVSQRFDQMSDFSSVMDEPILHGPDDTTRYLDRRDWALADAIVRWRHELASKFSDPLRDQQHNGVARD